MQMTTADKLRDLAMDLWWSWNDCGQRPFRELNPQVWISSNHDPLAVLEASKHDADRVAEIVDEALAHRKTYYKRTKHDRTKVVAYFCSEFAIHESIPQYSGGLGVLAGDHVKAASDMGLPLIGIGRLYRQGYYQQKLEDDGRTTVIEQHYDFAKFPITDTGLVVACPIDGSTVFAKVWLMKVGNSELYLLDTDHDGNDEAGRLLTQGLYKGNPAGRLRQQILLGVGGVRVLRELGIQVVTYHLNEGHAAFAAVERVRELCSDGATFEDAITEVRDNTVFTTHTPVPAGHDRYVLDAVKKAMQLSNEELSLGIEPDGNDFCMTVLALRLASKVNGVAKLHGEISREMWKHVYGKEQAKDVPIGHVTNGVHIPTWQHPRAVNVCKENLWEIRNVLRRALVNEVKQRSGIMLQDDVLTIGFARRFASYKRAPLIFRDEDRLAAILSNAKKPVQIIFAGKAHPADQKGQGYLQQIVQFSKDKRFIGKVVVLEEYDMGVGRLLTSGCDVWLNNPIRPHEASGTSGMKVPLHGGINCSIADGWWPEAYDGNNGWVIGEQNEDNSVGAIDNDERDERDANALYKLLEEEIIPAFYERTDGKPLRWIEMAAHSLESIPPQFSARRMVREYSQHYYSAVTTGSGSMSSSV